MILEILKYRLVCDVAAGSAEVAPRPEMATPVTFAKFWELHLNAMRRAPFDTSNDVADRDMRWYLDEHVDMLFGQNARDDLYPQFLAVSALCPAPCAIAPSASGPSRGVPRLSSFPIRSGKSARAALIGAAGLI